MLETESSIRVFQSFPRNPCVDLKKEEGEDGKGERLSPSLMN